MDYTTLGLLAGSLGVAAWQFLRAQKLRQRLTDAHAQRRDEEKQMQEYWSQRLQRETGATTIDELITRWRALTHDLGYALHHVEEFEPTALLKKQFVSIGSALRVQSKQSTRYTPPPFWAAGPPQGGFREMEGDTEDEIDGEMRLLLDGLDTWQLAGICCSILDGYYLEGAFANMGISVLSPTGKAMAMGKHDTNPYGAKLNVNRKYSKAA